ncbi:uncharacterized protein LOC141901280 [Tubulanus polymorphus]|uniref:uncharacterized protein LOC141901280 n=1 Tax=Tubulanus polymorphus TaxID=672921 RepID=UPI003DA49490
MLGPNSDIEANTRRTYHKPEKRQNNTKPLVDRSEFLTNDKDQERKRIPRNSHTGVKVRPWTASDHFDYDALVTGDLIRSESDFGHVKQYDVDYPQSERASSALWIHDGTPWTNDGRTSVFAEKGTAEPPADVNNGNQLNTSFGLNSNLINAPLSPRLTPRQINKFAWEELEAENGYNSADYDTDLEDDFPVDNPNDYDAGGVYIYESECINRKVVPTSYLSKNLQTPHLRMRHHYIGAKGAIPLAGAMAKNTITEVLDIHDNFIGEEGAIYMADMLRENMFLIKLDISNNHIGRRGVQAFVDVLDVNTTLKSLSLSGNNLTDADAKLIADALGSNSSLTCLNISHNQIGDIGGGYIADGLENNIGLMDLDLSWNAIRQNGAVAIMNALNVNKCLEILDLEWNGLSLNGTVALGNALKVNHTLRVLDLSNNRLTDEGTQNIANGLKANIGLETLLINMSPIGEVGMNYVLDAVGPDNNQTLKLLGIEDIALTGKTYLRIKEVEREKDITVLHGGLGGYLRSRTEANVYALFDEFVSDNKDNLEVWFQQMDEDMSGDVSTEELRQGLKLHGLRLTNKHIDMLLDQLDTDQSGAMDYNELLEGRWRIHEKCSKLKTEVANYNPDPEKVAEILEKQMKMMPVITTPEKVSKGKKTKVKGGKKPKSKKKSGKKGKKRK